MDWEEKYGFMEDAEFNLIEASKSLSCAGETDLAALVESVVSFVTRAKNAAGGEADRQREEDDRAMRREYERSVL